MADHYFNTFETSVDWLKKTLAQLADNIKLCMLHINIQQQLCKIAL